VLVGKREALLRCKAVAGRLPKMPRDDLHQEQRKISIAVPKDTKKPQQRIACPRRDKRVSLELELSCEGFAAARP
jgi:hypothetical protein